LAINKYSSGGALARRRTFSFRSKRPSGGAGSNKVEIGSTRTNIIGRRAGSLYPCLEVYAARIPRRWRAGRVRASIACLT
jgi:hypothetical protein